MESLQDFVSDSKNIGSNIQSVPKVRLHSHTRQGNKPLHWKVQCGQTPKRKE